MTNSRFTSKTSQLAYGNVVYLMCQKGQPTEGGGEG